MSFARKLARRNTPEAEDGRRCTLAHEATPSPGRVALDKGRPERWREPAQGRLDRGRVLRRRTNSKTGGRR